MRRHPEIGLYNIRGYNLQANGKLSGETQGRVSNKTTGYINPKQEQTNSLESAQISVGDRERNVLTTDLRRYYSLLCFIGTPQESEIKDAVRRALDGQFEVITSTAAKQRKEDYKKPPPSKRDAELPDPPQKSSLLNVSKSVVENSEVSIATPRQITPRPNNGAVCPGWIPPEANTPLDEGENIDFALLVEDRPKVRSERAKLLDELDAAQKQNPEDNWITGQRVRFAFDQRDTVRMATAANDCRGDEVWCLQLKGFALQHSEKFLEAEKTFRQAEAASPASAIKDSLCGFGETLMLLNHDDVDEIRKRPCSAQRALIDNVWWLADPLWSVPGNERYIDHHVRKVQVALRSVTDRDERYVWQDVAGGGALREMVIRYGWPSYTYWPGRKLEEEMSKYREFGRNQNFFRAPPYTAKEYTFDRTALLPTGKALFDPFVLNDDAWNLYPKSKVSDDWWPQEHTYYPTRLGKLGTGQDVMWRRDTAIAYQLNVDDALKNLDRTSTAASKSVLMGGENAVTTKQIAQTALVEGQTLRLRSDLASKPIVLSAEILPRTLLEGAMRRRYAVKPPPTLRDMKAGDVALSEPLLMRLPNRTVPVPIDQPTVLRYMAGTLTFTRDEPVAIYWESYGFAPGDTVQVDLKFRSDNSQNAAQRMLGAVGIGGNRDSVSIKWTEPDPGHAAVFMSGARPVIGRSVGVDLSALEGGTYVLSIEMRKGTSITARSERRIVVNKRAQ